MVPPRAPTRQRRACQGFVAAARSQGMGLFGKNRRQRPCFYVQFRGQAYKMRAGHVPTGEGGGRRGVVRKRLPGLEDKTTRQDGVETGTKIKRPYSRLATPYCLP